MDIESFALAPAALAASSPLVAAAPEKPVSVGRERLSGPRFSPVQCARVQIRG